MTREFEKKAQLAAYHAARDRLRHHIHGPGSERFVAQVWREEYQRALADAERDYASTLNDLERRLEEDHA